MARRHLSIILDVTLDEDAVREQPDGWLDEFIGSLVIGCETLVHDQLIEQDQFSPTAVAQFHKSGVTYESDETCEFCGGTHTDPDSSKACFER